MAEIIPFKKLESKIEKTSAEDDNPFEFLKTLDENQLENFFNSVADELDNSEPVSADECIREIADCYKQLLKFAGVVEYSKIHISPDDERVVTVNGKDIDFDEIVTRDDEDQKECLMKTDTLFSDLITIYGFSEQLIIKNVEDFLNS